MTDPSISTDSGNSEPGNSAPNTSQPGPALPPDIDALSYEEAREQLVAVVSKLEAGGTSLEDSLALWERGEALARRCEEWLEGARKRLAAARKDS
ncbi:MAG TPA: exodeoxyribonuclease VII small subunit [Arthrobacter sp.]|jgi:exodeoxyribonuclease VII small subunit|uniref:exodeoxyribonuclease VII small subunit n=1 Tax=Arthrobacter sp. TaxID=1667 RepID=UPI002F42009F